MTRKHTTRIILALILVTVALPCAASLAATKAAAPTGPNCIKCHTNPKTITSPSVFMDNSPSLSDIKGNNYTTDYFPPSAETTWPNKGSFYPTAFAFENSGHGTQTDIVPFNCTNCHGPCSPVTTACPSTNIADPHDGLNGLPTYLNSCSNCHGPTDPFFPNNFPSTAHGNVGLVPGLKSSQPGPFFDQESAGKLQAQTVLSSGHESGLLFEADMKTKVSRNMRIAECSVCHNYLSRVEGFWPNYGKTQVSIPSMFPDGELPTYPQNMVGCTACHDSHFNSPAIDERPTASNTVTISAAHGSASLQPPPSPPTAPSGVVGSATVLQTTPTTGRSASYQNFKPYKQNSTGAQDWLAGTWTRGSEYESSTRVIVAGTGTMGSATGSSTSDLISDITVTSGSLSDVQPGNIGHTYTLFVSGTASGSATLPSTAAAGAVGVPVTATFNNYGLSIGSVSENSVTLVDSSTNKGIVGSTSVTYTLTAGGTATTPAISLPLTGTVNFTIKDTYNNLQTLCAACHAQGKYLYSAYAQDPATGAWSSANPTMNLPVYQQFVTSQHGNATASSSTQSTSSLTGVAVGSNQTLVVPAGLSWLNPGLTLYITSTTDPATQYLKGIVTSYNPLALPVTNPPTGSLVVNVTSVVGSGSGSSWNVTTLSPAAAPNTSATATPGFFNFRAGGGTAQQFYPLDMSLATDQGTPLVGSSSGLLVRNGGNLEYQVTSPNSGTVYLSASGNTQLNNTAGSYVCNHCHHGLGAIDYLTDVQGTSSARVLWGDSTLTCITCHDTHNTPDGQPSNANLRIPVKLTYHPDFQSTSNVRGGNNSFLDGTSYAGEGKTDLSALGNDAVCVFCHQGRESGLTYYVAYANQTGKDFYANPTTVISPTGLTIPQLGIHHFPEAAVFWSKNAWEFPTTTYPASGGQPQTYSYGNAAHQAINCSGCHMDTASDSSGTTGGHTWTPSVLTCQKCHGTDVTSFDQVPASQQYSSSLSLAEAPTVGEQIGGAPENSQYSASGTFAESCSSGVSCSGLVGDVVQAFNSVSTTPAGGICYNTTSCSFTYCATGASYTGFTPAQLAAAFNVYMMSCTNVAPHSYIHNIDYVTEILQDSITALGGAPTGVRPSGGRPFTDYRTFDWNTLTYPSIP
ncbi:MAG: hypothetical protein WAN11_03785 [Syntrophobacteraceae bacterium]